jgi:hypothetical protein
LTPARVFRVHKAKIHSIRIIHCNIRRNANPETVAHIFSLAEGGSRLEPEYPEDTIDGVSDFSVIFGRLQCNFWTKV